MAERLEEEKSTEEIESDGPPSLVSSSGSDSKPCPPEHGDDDDDDSDDDSDFDVLPVSSSEHFHKFLQYLQCVEEKKQPAFHLKTQNSLLFISTAKQCATSLRSGLQSVRYLGVLV